MQACVDIECAVAATRLVKDRRCQKCIERSKKRRGDTIYNTGVSHFGFCWIMSVFRSTHLLRQAPVRCLLCSTSQQHRGLQTGSPRMAKVEKVAVIGSGLMGSGIAQVRIVATCSLGYRHGVPNRKVLANFRLHQPHPWRLIRLEP